jgi:glutamyl-tRNA reductase
VSIVVFGISHRSAPLDLLERCSIAAVDLPKRLADLTSRAHVSEAVLLSTCNRTEAYVVAEKFHGAFADVRNFFAETSHVAPEDLSDHLYVHHDEEAVEHLFSVTAGVRSVVLGESEILGQTKVAWEQARLEGAAGPVLNLLFRHAVETGKRARTETSIGRHTASVSHAAVEMATDRLGSFAGRKALIVGAGGMAEGMAVSLAQAGLSEVLVANRTYERAVTLAERVSGTALALDQLSSALVDVDVLLTSTGATSVIVDHASIDDVLVARRGRPLLIVDVAVPRDVAPAVADLPGVTLLDMEDLSKFAARGIEARSLEVERVNEIIEEETKRFGDVRSAREMAPIISSLRGQIEAIRRSEIERASSQLDSLDDQQRATVEMVTKSLVAKLLHGPTISLKEAAGSPKGDRLADSLRDLFDL